MPVSSKISFQQLQRSAQGLGIAASGHAASLGRVVAVKLFGNLGSRSHQSICHLAVAVDQKDRWQADNAEFLSQSAIHTALLKDHRKVDRIGLEEVLEVVGRVVKADSHHLKIA